MKNEILTPQAVHWLDSSIGIAQFLGVYSQGGAK